MNTVTQQLAIYTRDLLTLPEGVVVIMGRTNIPRGADTETLQISVDQLAQSTPLTDSYTYDGQGEVMAMNQLWRALMTIDFMGDDAYNQVTRFIALNRHQKGFELKQALEIDLQLVSGITDLKMLQGQQYSERYQIELTMMHNISLDIDTKRIDTACFDEFLTN